MTIRNILTERDFIADTLGNPASGYRVHLFEPGSTTARIASFSDGNLQAQNPNPVVLDGAGKASIWVSRNCDILITDGPLITDPVLVDERNANPDDLGSATDSGLVPNGSFEVDTDADDTPDGWDRTNEVGSNNGLDDTVSSDGLQSMRFTSAGNGGGNIITTNFFPVNDLQDLRVNFDIQSTVVDVRNIVRVEWFDVSQVAISNTDVYDNAVSNPLAFTQQALLATPPANARFAKLRLIGCDPSDPTVGTTYFDRVQVFYPLVVSGVFDNITIQNNEILSTNTNGQIEIEPNGTGVLDLGAGTAAAAFNVNIRAAAGQDARFNFEENNVQVGAVLHDASANAMRIQAITAGDQIFIEEGGAANIAAVFTPNAGQQLRHANVARLATTANGIQVTGQQVDIDARGGGAFVAALTGRVDAGGFQFLLADTGQILLSHTTELGVPEKFWAQMDRDGGVLLNFNDTLRFQTTNTGFSAAGSIFVLASGSADLMELELRNSVGGMQTTVDASGNVFLRQISSTGVGEGDFIDMTRDGAIGLRRNNVLTARTGEAAWDVISDGVLSPSLDFYQSNGTVRHGFIEAGSSGFVVRSEALSGTMLFQGEDAADVLRTLLTLDPDGGVSARHLGIQVMATRNDGISIRGDGTDTLINFENLAGTQTGFMRMFQASGNFEIQGVQDGGQFRVLMDSSSSSTQTLITADPDALATAVPAVTVPALRISSENDLSAISTTHGFQIGPTSGTNIGMDNNEIQARVNGVAGGLNLNVDGGSVVMGITGGTRIVLNNASTIQLQTAGEDAIVCTPNSDVALHYNGTEAARTAPNTSGTGFFLVNDGVAFRRVYGKQVVKKNSATNRPSTTTLADDPDLQINSLAAGNYKVEAWLIFHCNSATPDIRVGLDWSGATNDVRGLLWFGPPTTAGAAGNNGLVAYDQINATPANTVFGLAANSSVLVYMTAILDANGVGNLRIQWAQNTSDATALELEAQSRMEVTLLEA